MRKLADAVAQERFGRIKCERRAYDEMDDALRAEMFSHIAVLELKLDWMRGTIEIAGASPMFDVLPQPCEPPLYDAIVHREMDGDVASYRVEFVQPKAYAERQELLLRGRILPR